MSTHIVENIESSSAEEFMTLMEHFAQVRGMEFEWVEKAVRTPGGEEIGEEFEEWFLQELQRRWQRHFVSAREQIWRVVETYIRRHGGVYSRLTPGQMIELQNLLFEAGLAHTQHMLGIQVDRTVAHRLERWGWTEQERADFPGVAYRFGVIKTLIEAGTIRNFAELLRAAMSHPLSDAERNAIAIAELRALNLLRPVFDHMGRLITGELLEREQAMLRTLVVSALENRTHPLVLARDMLKLDRAIGIFRDFERIARTEIAGAFAEGSFQENWESGKFTPESLVYRIPRPNACKVCVDLFIGPDGTPRLYRAADIRDGTAPAIDVGVRVPRLVRAPLREVHPNCLCPPWEKHWGRATDNQFHRYRDRYLEARRRVRLAIQEAA